jgi:hypothetical protein
MLREHLLMLELVGSGRLDLAKTARNALEEMKELLAKHIDHRDRLIGELAKMGGRSQSSRSAP